MESVPELVGFLTRSSNRLAVLEALSTAPTTRPELQEQTGVPRATLSRILADLRDRDIVERSGHDYALTPLGARVADELADLFTAVERHRALQTLADWLPLDRLDVDLFDVEDRSVTLPSRLDPMAPIGRAATIVGEADHVRGFCYSILHAPILAMTEDLVDTGGRFEGVVSAAVLDVVASDPELVAPVRALVETGRADLAVLDRPIESQFIITDDLVLFLVTDGEGTLQGLVETGEPAIRPWAEERFATYRAEADPLDLDGVDELLTT